MIKENFDKENIFFPPSQVDPFDRVLKELYDRESAEGVLCEEYLSILFALRQMQIPFSISLLNPGPINREFLGFCETLGFRTVKLGSFSPQIMAFPRDFCTVFDEAKLIVFNNRAIEGPVPKRAGWKSIVSQYGEGGYVLARDSTMVIGRRLAGELSADINLFRKTGLRVGMFPSVVTAVYSRLDNSLAGVQGNGHIDRVACLLRDKNAKLHLVVDPKIVTVGCDGNDYTNWFLQDHSETLKIVRDTFEPMGIKIHSPSEVRVPCSLNMVQFPDNKVLMTGGDPAVKKTVGDIVGSQNVVTTSSAIKFLPILMHGGIRCLLGRIPKPFLE